MIENRPIGTFLAHIVMLIGVLIVGFPVWITFVAATHDQAALLRPPIPLWPGDQFFVNMNTILFEGVRSSKSAPVAMMLLNSTVMALGVAIGKIIISILSAFAIVYFRFPFRNFFFWMIFVTLMLPVEVRILPTYAVVANLNLLNNYGGLIVPLIASATATFLFRQFFMSVPDELTEAARIDGATPMRFFWDILLPLSRNSISALFVIQFIYGWNQYLWPLLVTTDQSYYTIVMGISRMLNVVDAAAEWNLVMATAILALVPPVVIIIAMQRQFVRGLVETEK